MNFAIGDVVEIISVNDYKAMPAGLTLGSRGTVVESPTSFFVGVDYGLPDGKVWSRFDSIRKVPPPPPQREATSSWDDVIVWRPKSKEIERVG